MRERQSVFKGGGLENVRSNKKEVTEVFKMALF